MKKISIPFAPLFSLLFLFSCSVNKAKIDNDLKEYFSDNKVEGSFSMLNNADGEITVYNISMDTARVSPFSTFNILNALIALENGVVTDLDMNLKISDSSNEKGMNITQAFKSDFTPFFQKISKQTGKAAMQKWVDSISYGNKNIGDSLHSFWVDNKIKISPDEQLGFLKRLYFDQLPFRKSVQLQVRDMMVQEDNSAYKWSYVMGNGKDENDQFVSWLIGWVEENRHVYFFTTLIKYTEKNQQQDQVVLKISKDILTHYDFFKGKK